MGRSGSLGSITKMLLWVNKAVIMWCELSPGMALLLKKERRYNKEKLLEGENNLMGNACVSIFEDPMILNLSQPERPGIGTRMVPLTKNLPL
jgi:hypothetical protein